MTKILCHLNITTISTVFEKAEIHQTRIVVIEPTLTAMANKEITQRQPSTTNKSSIDNKCLLFELPTEIPDHVLSYLFPILPDGRPERRVTFSMKRGDLLTAGPPSLPTQASASEDRNNPCALAILLTCRSFYDALHRKAYTNIDWELDASLGLRRHSKLGQGECMNILSSVTHNNIRNMKFMRGDIECIKTFLRARDKCSAAVQDGYLKLLAVPEYSFELDCTGQYAPAEEDLLYEIKECYRILEKWKKLSGMKLLMELPQEDHKKVDFGMSESELNIEIVERIQSNNSGLAVDVEWYPGGNTVMQATFSRSY